MKRSAFITLALNLKGDSQKIRRKWNKTGGFPNYVEQLNKCKNQRPFLLWKVWCVLDDLTYFDGKFRSSFPEEHIKKA